MLQLLLPYPTLSFEGWSSAFSFWDHERGLRLFAEKHRAAGVSEDVSDASESGVGSDGGTDPEIPLSISLTPKEWRLILSCATYSLPDVPDRDQRENTRAALWKIREAIRGTT